MYYRCRDMALSNGGTFHLAAVLFRRKSLIKIGTNQRKSHPQSIHPKPSGHVCRSMHAEQCALIQAKPGDTLYVIRFRKDGSVAMAKPCETCQEWLLRKGVTEVYYTDQNGEWNELELAA